ncbi:GIY-YIG nuclease family protein (plasmid) [Microtetraspora malaysiensis]|uniref:GIY-YIG nuclease family protein n=1 Tax=Microtetraspora malaysiensis TaxID=161358 RepID=UPI003D8ED6B9
MSVPNAAQDPNITPAVVPGIPEDIARIALDSDLSYCARGILIYQLVRGEGLTAAEITADGPEGRDAVRSALEELAALGYRETVKVRENGRIGWRTRVSAVPGALSSTPIPSVVYFVLRDGHVKIGTTKRLTYRLGQISRGASTPRWMPAGPVELLGTTSGGWEREHEIHAMFAAERVEGEWFRDCPAIRAFVADLAATGEEVAR